MDVSRSPSKRKMTVRLGATAAVILVALVTFGLSRMRAAVPTVDRGAIVIDTVHRGPMVREIRGSGTLTPEEVRLISIPTDGRVERVLVQPGNTVEAGTIVLEL